MSRMNMCENVIRNVNLQKGLIKNIKIKMRNAVH